MRGWELHYLQRLFDRPGLVAIAAAAVCPLLIGQRGSMARGRGHRASRLDRPPVEWLLRWRSLDRQSTWRHLRSLARWVDARRKTAPDIETVYQLRVVCEDRDKSVIRTVLLRHVNAQSRMTVQSIATQDTEQPGRTAALADVYATERSERAMEAIVRRLDIEPGVVALTWSQRQ